MNEGLSSLDKRVIEILEERNNIRIKKHKPAASAQVKQAYTAPKPITYAPIQKPASKPAPANNSGTRQSLNFFCNYMQNTGGIIAPEREIKIGKRKTTTLNDNGILKYERAEVSYNARLTLSLLTLLVGGTMLYYGPPGCGKTSEIAAYAKLGYNTDYKTSKRSAITCNQQQTFSDVFAYPDFGELMGPRHREKFKPRPILRAPVKFFDEIEKGNKDITNHLLEWLQDGSVSYRGQRFIPPKGPFYFAANDLAPLSKPFMDRINVLVRASSISPYNMDFVNKRVPYENIIDKIRPMQPGELQKIRKEINAVQLDDEAKGRIAFFFSQLKYCVYGGKKTERQIKDNLPEDEKPSQLCTKRTCKFLSEGYLCNMTKEAVSVRTYQSTYLYTKAFAWLRGKSKASMEDLEAILPYTIAHKLTPTNNALDKDAIYKTDPFAFIEDIFEASGKAYGNVVAKFPKISELSEMISRAYTSGKKSGINPANINTMIDDLKKVDSPLVCGLIIDLEQIKRLIK
jgi:MoxR-like ATPase